jgi:hypothetical protein
VPRYRFTIRDTDHFDDEEGVILADDQSARAYGVRIMNELQKANETDWAGYILEVMRDDRIIWQRLPARWAIGAPQ